MRVPLALALLAAVGVVGGCSRSPTGPTVVSVASVSADGASWASTVQTFTVKGAGFESGITVSVTGPIGAPTEHKLNYVATNITPKSFDLTAVLPAKGTFKITVTPPSGDAVSGEFSVAERVLACSNPIDLGRPYDPTFPIAPRIIARLVDRTNVSETIALLSSHYQFTPLGVLQSLGGFEALAPDALVDALRCDPAIKSINYETFAVIG